MSRVIVVLVIALVLSACVSRRPNRMTGCTGPIAAYAICDDAAAP